MEALKEIQKRFYTDFPAHPMEARYGYATPSTMKPTQWTCKWSIFCSCDRSVSTYLFKDPLSSRDKLSRPESNERIGLRCFPSLVPFRHLDVLGACRAEKDNAWPNRNTHGQSVISESSWHLWIFSHVANSLSSVSQILEVVLTRFQESAPFLVTAGLTDYLISLTVHMLIWCIFANL